MDDDDPAAPEHGDGDAGIPAPNNSEPEPTHEPDPTNSEPQEEVTPDEPEPQASKPKAKARQKKAKLPRPVGAIRNWRDLRALPEREFALPILPKRGVVMFAGAKSVGKTFTVDCLLGMVGYGVPWCDGTKTRRALAFVVTNEDKPDWDRKHSAWLTLMGKPIIEQDNVKFVEPADESFHREVETKRHGTVKIDRLDLLDLESVKVLIAQCQQTMKAEKLGCGILALDNLASLVPGRLDKPQIQLLVRHLHLIADKLNCCVILVNHVHLKNAQQYQGLASLGDLIDGLFYVSRNGMKTYVLIDRLKGGVADGMTYEFAATVVTLGFRKTGKPITSLAIRLVGLVGKDVAAIDHAAGIRKMICEKTRPDVRYSSSQIIRMMEWDKQSKSKGDGGNQHKALQRAVPTDWVAVAMDDGTAREIRRVVETNPTRHWIETRVLKPPPKPRGTPVKADQTPDPDTPDGNVVNFPTTPKPPL